MIATHNSATGEKGKGFLSWLLTPFCRCQSKNLREQFYGGCRYFDLRIKDTKDHKTVFAHGFWVSSKDVNEALYELDMLAATDKQQTYVMITYEGKRTNLETEFWKEGVQNMMRRYPNLILTQMNIKKPSWTNIYKCTNCPATEQGYFCLDGTSLLRKIPLPKMWDWIHKDLKAFADVKSNYVWIDFM